MDKYLITGGTGLIGSSIIKQISAVNTVVCPVRDIEKAETVLRGCNNHNIQLIECDLETYLGEVEGAFDYIIHCASPTASKYFVSNPVETMRFSIETTTKILDFAQRDPVKGIVYLSSLESYGTINNDIKIREDFQGYVNPLNTRSSYNIAKRTCEALCHSYAEEYDIPVKIARLTQTISPNISESDMRVFAQFAKSAAAQSDIELHTEGKSARQYLFIDDAVSAILTILYKGKKGEAYNVANQDTYISAKDLANFVQSNFNPTCGVTIRIREDMGYAPTTMTRLDTSKIEALGWEAKVDLYGMFNSIISKLKKNNV